VRKGQVVESNCAADPAGTHTHSHSHTHIHILPLPDMQSSLKQPVNATCERKPKNNTHTHTHLHAIKPHLHGQLLHRWQALPSTPRVNVIQHWALPVLATLVIE
jgi:hypothetical protein